MRKVFYLLAVLFIGSGTALTSCSSDEVLDSDCKESKCYL